ncbi:hypothetical protein [Devosia rhizoryzae]|nr:hypothetical protein [Devosia rhizoryzae]
MVKAGQWRCTRLDSFTPDAEVPMRRTLMISSLYAVSLAMLILPYGLMQ